MGTEAAEPRSPFGFPWARDKWHAKSPARGKCPAILPHQPLISGDGESVSVLTFTSLDEAWAGSCVRAQPRASRVAIHRGSFVSRVVHSPSIAARVEAGRGCTVER